MKTTLPISTISFNTEKYLALKLNELLKAHVISFWAYIKHKPEEDEKKPHLHVWLELARSLQTEELREQFIEPCENKKPRKCLPFQKSKFGDWYLYCLHDIQYLNSKGQQRVHHYKRENFRVSDVEYFDELIRQIDLVKQTPYKLMHDYIASGYNFEEFVSTGNVPINQFTNFQKAFKSVQSQTFRNGRPGHGDLDQEDD